MSIFISVNPVGNVLSTRHFFHVKIRFLARYSVVFAAATVLYTFSSVEPWCPWNVMHSMNNEIFPSEIVRFNVT